MRSNNRVERLGVVNNVRSMAADLTRRGSRISFYGPRGTLVAVRGPRMAKLRALDPAVLGLQLLLRLIGSLWGLRGEASVNARTRLSETGNVPINRGRCREGFRSARSRRECYLLHPGRTEPSTTRRSASRAIPQHGLVWCWRESRLTCPRQFHCDRGGGAGKIFRISD